MYKISTKDKIDKCAHFNVNVSTYTGVKDVISVRRPKSRSSSLMSSVLPTTNSRCTSKTSKKVESHVRNNNKSHVTSNVNYMLSVNSEAMRTLFTFLIAAKTRFIDATHIAAKSKFGEATPLKANSKNETLKSFYEKLGITHQKSVARTPEQNGVVERSNRTLVVVARTMLIFSNSPNFLWAEAVATAYFTQNCSLIHTYYNKTSYEFTQERKPNVQFFHVFGSLCYPTNDRDDLKRLKPKVDIGISIRYSETQKLSNRRTRKTMKTINVKFNELTAVAFECNCLEPDSNRIKFQDPLAESSPTPTKEDLDNLFGPMYDEYFEKRTPIVLTDSAAPDTIHNDDTPSSTTIIVSTTTYVEMCMYALTMSTTEPKNIKEAMQDHSLIESMQEELHQFERLSVWELVERPVGRNIIGVKWLWKNKTDAENTVIINKSRLIAKEYHREEGIEFEESFALMARLEAV
ncbi:retrovirus-related pol polyprotein from transposon TNT 1-94 [Tanacetum coccineum]